MNIQAILEATLEDGALSRSEGQALRQLVADHKHDRETLARFRNTAFDLAEERIAQSPEATLKWLSKVDKIIDNAARDHDAKPDIDASFSPGDDCLAMILTHLKAAKRSVDICVFTITDDRVTQAILDAHRRGVAVRIVTDNDKQFDTGSDIHRLRDAGVPTRHDPTDNHMHHKYAIIDGEVLLNGSYNWTRGATRNCENLMALRDTGTLRHFADVFEKLWKSFR